MQPLPTRTDPPKQPYQRDRQFRKVHAPPLQVLFDAPPEAPETFSHPVRDEASRTLPTQDNTPASILHSRMHTAFGRYVPASSLHVPPI